MLVVHSIMSSRLRPLDCASCPLILLVPNFPFRSAAAHDHRGTYVEHMSYIQERALGIEH